MERLSVCASIVPELRGRRGAAGCQLTPVQEISLLVFRCHSCARGLVSARQSGAVQGVTAQLQWHWEHRNSASPAPGHNLGIL